MNPSRARLEEAGIRKNQLTWILSTFAVIVLLDQVTKAIVVATMEPGMAPRYDVFFHFTHQRNEGLVGGVFSHIPVVPYAAPLIATVVLLYLYRFLDPRARLQALSYGMVFGGAVGNIIDRLRLGSVTDFLQFHFYFIPFDMPWKYYPAFNVADSAICVGVVLLILSWNTGPAPGGNASSTV